MNYRLTHGVVIAILAALPLDPSNAAALRGGETLWAGQSIYSDDLKYLATMQADGNLVVYRNDDSQTAIWSTGTTGRGADHAVMQNDGNFVLYTAENRPVWWTASNGQGRLFTVTEHGQAMVLSVEPTWTSGSGAAWMPPGEPMVFAEGTIFPKGHTYSHTNGHDLSFQADGNMVLYRYGSPVWSSRTWRASSAEFNNGLHVTGGKKRNFHAGSLPGPKYGPSTVLLHKLGFLLLQANGNLVAYGAKQIWTAPQYDRQPAKNPGILPCVGDPRLCVPATKEIWRSGN